MELEHEFTVPVPVDRAWAVLLDVERVAPCMPGATLEQIDGEEFTGRVKVKVGPIQVVYTGRARFAEQDPAAHTVVIEASGKETRGTGTASATVRAVLADQGGDQTKVQVHTDLAITGKPAQFGRGVMVDVSSKLIGMFADCLAQQLAGQPAAGTAPAGSAGPVGSASPPPASPPATAPPPALSGEPPGPVPAEGAPPPPAPSREPPGPVPAEGAPPPAARTEAEPAAGAVPPRPTPSRPTPDVIDLLEVAGSPVLRRLGPPAVAALLGLLLGWLLGRRR